MHNCNVWTLEVDEERDFIRQKTRMNQPVSRDCLNQSQTQGTGIAVMMQPILYFGQALMVASDTDLCM